MGIFHVRREKAVLALLTTASPSVMATTQNRPSSMGYAYDSAGNMAANSGTTYSYDAENHLISTAGVNYMYDGDGKRVDVSQSNFVGDDYGIYVPPSISGLDQLTVLGSQFNCATSGIYVGSSLSNTLFSANLFIVPNTGRGIYLEQAFLYSAMGNSFNIGSPAKGGIYPIGIEVGSTAGWWE